MVVQGRGNGRRGTVVDGRELVRTVGDSGGRPGVGEDGRGLWGTAGLSEDGRGLWVTAGNG